MQENKTCKKKKESRGKRQATKATERQQQSSSVAMQTQIPRGTVFRDEPIF
jgi:hypothetical protein